MLWVVVYFAAKIAVYGCMRMSGCVNCCVYCCFYCYVYCYVGCCVYFDTFVFLQITFLYKHSEGAVAMLQSQD